MVVVRRILTASLADKGLACFGGASADKMDWRWRAVICFFVLECLRDQKRRAARVQWRTVDDLFVYLEF